MKYLAIIPLALIVAAIGGLAAALAISRPAPPPPLAAMSEADQLLAKPAGAVPPYSYYAARDGARLAYRLYGGRPGGGVAVLVHGSTGLAIAVHAAARDLAAAGITTYAIDLRGHGESGSLGDIGYRGQLEDDLADLVTVIEQRFPGERRLLAGHSLGGGFVLRAAGEPIAARFDGFLALSPFISVRSGTSRPGTGDRASVTGGWANAAVPRITVLSLLNGLGITAFDGLDVIAYAVPPNAEGKRARIYSHRLLANMSLPRDWQPALARIAKPAAVLVGANDQLFVASAYAAEIRAANPTIGVEVLAGVDHMGMVIQPAATEAIVRTAGRLLGH
ncbi:alpha/beta fold hydrolase [Phreatobacter sp. AB_2022a]|uniref:alpha/beta fold hydrolase n=1 Tax=Phreatobacter sp. AB_2022a TaxID=3003134 RepID=UPI002286D326|nr:alpha/beta fold hydrolase [Phreatobacter sp. AB_2022a]MCZ0738764.1 alpha/beta fold hydrolase [Phreatobacter sp. AB_2022a]